MKQIQMLDLKLEYEYMKKDIDSALARCLEHQKWIFGPEVRELEEALAAYLGVKHCIGVSSGTEALVLSLRALAIKTKGAEYFDRTDEIVTTPFTFTATGDAILRSGATPVFVDIDPETYNIDVNAVREYLGSSSGRVKGIIPVHLYGQSCRMDAIMDLAGKHDLFVVEDIAQAFGGGWQGRKLGSIGTTGCFSFFPSKNLGGFGDGGMISCNDEELDSLLRMLLKHGGRDKYNVDHIGYNARLDTLQAAIVLAKFKYIDEFNERRRKVAALYDKGLQGLDGLVLPVADPLPDVHHVYHQYTVRAKKRSNVQAYLKDKGIATMVYYPFPLHKMKVFEGRMKMHGDLRHSELAASEVFSLPVEPLQSVEDTEAIVTALRGFNK
ncbi:MAG: DegT/DnrJ/EryC1/StrS family aminotransferase [Nitrospirae bacterium]|nr:DegT/DnrJ/EryC1/StrS family aminotransferase [Nitrospirota bacterium]